ncbi:hypothetical protein GCM10011344_01390 [Dokdonia pacifica]|nr:hypothetical protein GCM10011344_01390 [Dokdonia pacifica]
MVATTFKIKPVAASVITYLYDKFGASFSCTTTIGSACESKQITASVSPLKLVVPFGFPVASKSIDTVPPSAASLIIVTALSEISEQSKSSNAESGSPI